MATARQQSIRLTDDDVAICEAIQERMGLFGASDAIRYALRYYAKAEKVELPKPKPKRKK